MKKYLLIPILVLIVSCTSTGTFQKHGVQTEYDRFEDSTTISANSAMVYTASLPMHQIQVSAFASCSGEEVCEPNRIRMNFSSISSGWMFLNLYPITFLIDGEAIRFEEDDINAIRNTLGGDNVSESLYFSINSQLFNKIAFSEKVEVKIGIVDFEMTHARRESLRLLYQELFPE